MKVKSESEVARLSSKHKKAVASVRIYIVFNRKIAWFAFPSNSCASKRDVHLSLIYSCNQIVHLLKEDSWVVKGKSIFPTLFFNFPNLIWKWKKDEISLAIELPDPINGVLCIFPTKLVHRFFIAWNPDSDTYFSTITYKVLKNPASCLLIQVYLGTGKSLLETNFHLCSVYMEWRTLGRGLLEFIQYHVCLKKGIYTWHFWRYSFYSPIFTLK